MLSGKTVVKIKNNCNNNTVKQIKIKRKADKADKATRQKDTVK